MYDDRPKREPSRWFLNNVSDEVERCVRAVRVQMKREMPSWATPEDYVLAHLFVAHELMAETWQSVNSAGSKERTYKLAEAMADVSQVLIDLTHRSEDDLSGKREIERRRSRIKGDA
ncbi:MAG: hypothetical protein EPO26_15325 [Chloroflexota bacterium]|nr:MAG: hypothetical protein EPO26_15325 [Chloroflexota bacterium]